MKGEVPWYLIAIVLAISVLVVFGYMYISRSGVFSNALSEQECFAKKELYCSLWKIGQKPSKSWEEYAPVCFTTYQIKISEDGKDCGIKP